MVNPDALVVAVNNLSEGTNSKNAFDISRRIAEDHFPNVTIIEGTSPQDVPKIVQNHLGGSLRMEVNGDVIDYSSNLTISATEVISSGEVHGTIFGSFSANGGFWECEFKDEPSTVILTQ